MSLIVPEFLYHGSAEAFSHVDVRKGRPYKDFGKGFYMSVDRNQAVGMMHKKFDELMSRGIGGQGLKLQKSLYRIALDRSYVEGLKIKEFGRADVEWLDFILMCRRVDGVPHNYDVVIGPTADMRTCGKPDDEAYRMVYDSELFKLLSEPKTNLYLQTNAELCGFFDVEKNFGKNALRAALVG